MSVDDENEQCSKEQSQQQSQTKSRLNKNVVSYEFCAWTIFGALTVWAVIDRFYGNIWDMGINRPFDSSAPLAQQIYDLYAWFSGRVLLVTTSVLFLTQCRVTMEWFVTHAPLWLYTGDLHDTNNRIHRFAGKLTGWVVVLHVWAVFLPSLIHGYDVIVIAQSKRGDIPFLSSETSTVALATDDVWRLIEMTILFGVLFPFSMWTVIKAGRKRRFSFSMIIHLIAGIMFAIDIARKNSHPHSHVFNVPILVYWLIDRLIGIYWFRKGTASIVHLDSTNDGRYMIAFLRLDDKLRKSIDECDADYVYLRMPQRLKEYAHPFTVWRKYGDLHDVESDSQAMKINYETIKIDTEIASSSNASLGLVKSTSFAVWNRRRSVINDMKVKPLPEEETEDVEAPRDSLQPIDTNSPKSETQSSSIRSQIHSTLDYDLACIIQVHTEPPAFLRPKAWTKELHEIFMASEDNLPTMTCYGPYTGVFSTLYGDAKNLPGLLLIASGGGAGSLINFQQYLLHSNISLQRPVVVLFTANSPDLFAFVASVLCSKHIDNYYARGWITNSSSDHEQNSENLQHVYFENGNSVAKAKSGPQSPSRSRDIKGTNERMSMEKEMIKAQHLGVTEVLSCGSPVLQNVIRKTAASIGLKYRRGYTFG